VPPYPFSQRPYFVEFKKRLTEEFGCEYKILEFKLDALEFYTVPCFERNIGGRVVRTVAIFDDYDRLEFSDIRRICRTLEIPPAEFGLDLTSEWFNSE
jgi:hypothetical protein